jgi:SOS response regulatory protein OraA/RecX
MTTPDAVDAAVRALSRRDRSESDVRRILERKGVSDDETARALEVLRRLGALDDARFAMRSAETLAQRGYGDAAILARLEREGVEHELALEAVASLEPETERAAVLVARRGRGVRTARWLGARGFDADSVEAAARPIAESDIRELG